MYNKWRYINALQFIQMKKKNKRKKYLSWFTLKKMFIYCCKILFIYFINFCAEFIRLNHMDHFLINNLEMLEMRNLINTYSIKNYHI